MLSQDENESNVAVESEQDIRQFNSPFLLDHISLVFTIFFFGCLIAFLLFRSNNTAERRTFYACNQSYHYYSLHLDLRIDQFTELHRNVKIWIAGERSTKGDTLNTRPLNYTIDTTGIRRKATVSFYRTPIQQASFNFGNGAVSDKIFMTNVLLNSSYDTVNVHFILNSDFQNFLGMHVYWQFCTAPKPTYITFLQVLLPATTLYLTIHFLFHFTSMTEQFTQINIAILGVVSVLAALPYTLIFGSKFNSYPQFFFSSVMVSYFRYIVASQIQLEAEGTQSPNMKVNSPLIIFFVIYSFIELAVTFSGGRNASIFKLLMTCANFSYFGISIALTIWAFLKSDTGYSRRLIFMCVLEALTFLLLFRDQDYHSVSQAIATPLQRTLTFGASHIFMISYLLILLQICSDVGYAEITAHNNDQSSLLARDKMGVDLNLEPEIEEEEDIEEKKN